MIERMAERARREIFEVATVKPSQADTTEIAGLQTHKLGLIIDIVNTQSMENTPTMNSD